jgi:ATP-binding cassette subfamily B protein
LREFFRRHKWRYVVGLFWLIVVDALQLIVPKLLGRMTDILRAGALTRWLLLRYIAILIGLALAVAVGRFLWRVYVMGTARLLDYTLRNMLFAHLQKLSARYFNQHKTGDLMAHATNDIPAVRQALGPGVVLLADSTFLTIATVIIIFRTVPARLGVLSLLPFPFVAIAATTFGKMINARFRAVQEAFANLTDRTQENISGIRVVKSFVQEKAEVAKFMESALRNVDANMRLVRVWGLFHPFTVLIATLSFVVVLWHGAPMVIGQEISLGDFVAFTSYLGMLIFPMMAVGWVINMLQRGFASMERIHKILAEVPEVADSRDAIDLPEVKGVIEFSGLTFAYSESAGAVLHDISFRVEAGRTLAVVGRTGSGKTTLVNLLTRLYNPPRGTVFMDGHDINDISLDSLRRNIGCVPQDTFLFSTTLAENIAFSGPEPRERIEYYAKVAELYSDVSRFPAGFDTIVGERGVTLSGGQKQRVSIARALIREPRILILDDCLSAVDTQTEERILGRLREFMVGRTSIIISHRVSTVRHADEIIVLDDGRIAERGTHETLVAAGGLYQQLYERQLLEEKLESQT